MYCVGFSAQQILSLSLRRATGRPCVAEQAALLAALFALAAAALGALHTRVAHIDGLARTLS